MEMDSTADGTIALDELRAALPEQPHRRRVSLAAEHEGALATRDRQASSNTARAGRSVGATQSGLW